jgi:hypothetical protein
MGRVFSPFFEGLIEVPKLHSQESGLQLVQPKITTDHFVKIFYLGAMDPEFSHLLGQIRVFGRDQPTLTQGS